MAQLKFDELLEINGVKLTKKYIEGLSKDQRLELVEPIFSILRENEFIYPDDEPDLRKSYERLVKDQIDLNCDSVFNNSSLCTEVCRYFCRTFYETAERNKPHLIQVFNDDVKLRRLIKNRMGLDWLDDDIKKGIVRAGVNEAFNLSFKMMVQGMRSMRFVNATSMFKPNIAKFICEKYSSPGDLVGDYSCGFGGRLLGAMASGRRYRGTDPLTVPELRNMVEYFGFEGAELIDSGSEDYRGEENSVDLYWSSPPYYDQEYYSSDISQAYNKDEEYFYNKYWRGTMENVKFMLKPDKWFGLNITGKYIKMIDIAKEYFGEPVEVIKLRTVRSHLNKTAGIEKSEPLFMFKNLK